MCKTEVDTEGSMSSFIPEIFRNFFGPLWPLAQLDVAKGLTQ